jgi:hypothetical protein
VTAFFVGLGLDVEARMLVEGEFLDTVIGIPDQPTQIVMLRLPDGGTGIELSSFQARPRAWSARRDGERAGSGTVCFEVADLQASVDGLAADGHGLVGGIGQHENIGRMA